MNGVTAPLHTSSPAWLRVLRAIGTIGIWSILALLTLWAVAALYVDVRVGALRIPLTLIYVLGISTVLLKVKRKRWAALLCFAGFCGVLTWWLTLKPSDDGDWLPNVSRTARAEINGDQVIIHNLRNCDYRSETGLFQLLERPDNLSFTDPGSGLIPDELGNTLREPPNCQLSIWRQ